MRVVPLFGSGVYGKSAVVTRQRRINCYYEQRPDGDKSKVAIYGTPGLQLKYNVGGSSNLPVRALLGVNTALYMVVGNNFGLYNALGVLLYQAPIGTLSGLASLAANPAGSQIMLVDGSGGWVYTGGVLSPAPLASWFVPGSQTVTNVGGYFVTEYAGTAEFGVSNINDATTGYALSFATASAYPDTMVAVDNLGGNLVLFAQQHLEIWQPVGTPPPSQPFAPIQAAATQWGLAAAFARVHCDNTLIFLGVTIQGVKQFCQLNGYVVTPISDEIDWIINQTGFVVSDCVGSTYMRDKHPIARFTFPTQGRTFDFDCSTRIWHEAQTGIPQGAYQRHQSNLTTAFLGETLLTDYASGNVYRNDDGVFTDNGAVIVRQIITRHQTEGFNRFRIPEIYIDMETGVGVSGPAGTPGLNPMVSIECSKDNGRTWFPARLIPLGALGQYKARVKARRFGQARVFTFRITMTDPVKFVITDGAIIRKGKAATQ